MHEFSGIWERCSKFDFNMLTLRIGPFGVDEKKISFLVPLRDHDSRFTNHDSRIIPHLSDLPPAMNHLRTQPFISVQLNSEFGPPSLKSCFHSLRGSKNGQIHGNHGFTNFFGKTGSVTFLSLSSSNFVPNI